MKIIGIMCMEFPTPNGHCHGYFPILLFFCHKIATFIPKDLAQAWIAFGPPKEQYGMIFETKNRPLKQF